MRICLSARMYACGVCACAPPLGRKGLYGWDAVWGYVARQLYTPSSQPARALANHAFVAAGSDVVGGPVAIALTGGFSATGEFTVAPAPGALALLGLAGLAGRRKRA